VAEDSLKYFKKNPKIIIPDMFLFLLPFISGFIFLAINKLLIYSEISVEGFKDNFLTTFNSLLASTPGKIQLIVSTLIILISSIALGLGFISVRYIMIIEAIERRKIGLYRASRIAAHYAFHLFWVKFIVAIIYLLTFAILTLLVLTGNWLLISLAILLLIVSLIFYSIVFVFTIPEFFYAKTRNPIKAIHKASRFALKNLRFTCGTLITIIVISAAFYLINQSLTQMFSLPLASISLGLAIPIAGIFTLVISVIKSVWINGFLFTVYKKRS